MVRTRATPATRGVCTEDGMTRERGKCKECSKEYDLNDLIFTSWGRWIGLSRVNNGFVCPSCKVRVEQEHLFLKIVGGD